MLRTLAKSASTSRRRQQADWALMARAPSGSAAEVETATGNAADVAPRAAWCRMGGRMGE